MSSLIEAALDGGSSRDQGGRQPRPYPVGPEGLARELRPGPADPRSPLHSGFGFYGSSLPCAGICEGPGGLAGLVGKPAGKAGVQLPGRCQLKPAYMCATSQVPRAPEVDPEGSLEPAVQATLAKYRCLWPWGTQGSLSLGSEERFSPPTWA